MVPISYNIWTIVYSFYNHFLSCFAPAGPAPTTKTSHLSRIGTWHCQSLFQFRHLQGNPLQWLEFWCSSPAYRSYSNHWTCSSFTWAFLTTVAPYIIVTWHGTWRWGSRMWRPSTFTRPLRQKNHLRIEREHFWWINGNQYWGTSQQPEEMRLNIQNVTLKGPIFSSRIISVSHFLSIWTQTSQLRPPGFSRGLSIGFYLEHLDAPQTTSAALWILDFNSNVIKGDCISLRI